MEAYTYAQYAESAEALRAKLGSFTPKVLLILGSGLGSLGDEVEDAIVVPYEEVPHMKYSTAPGHKGQFVFGRLGGQDVAVMQGRLHTYEGWDFDDVSYPVRVLRLLGAETLLVTNAAGAVNDAFDVGDIMLITDHINFLGRNPLMGPNESDFGVRFCDMSYAYAPYLRQIALDAAEELGQHLEQGVYVATTGPSYETPAEIRMFRIWGASAVGMSTVPEVIVANHCGIDVMGISCITNMAAGVLDQKLSEEEVLETGARVGAEFQALMTRIVEKL